MLASFRENFFFKWKLVKKRSSKKTSKINVEVFEAERTRRRLVSNFLFTSFYLVRKFCLTIKRRKVNFCIIIDNLEAKKLLGVMVVLYFRYCFRNIFIHEEIPLNTCKFCTGAWIFGVTISYYWYWRSIK